MSTMNFEHLDRNDLIKHLAQLTRRCEDLEQINQNNEQIISSQNQKITDYQKKITDISSSMRLLF